MSSTVARRMRTAAIAAVAASALVLSACSSGDSGSSTTSAAASSAASSAPASSASSSASSSGSAGASASSSAGSGAGASDADVAAAKAALIKPGALVVCTSLSYEPFQFVQNDEVVGFDVDLLDLVAAKLGVTQEIIDTPFEGIKSGDATATKKCDAAAAAMSITPEREAVMLFSEPYFDANQALVVPEASTATTLADLQGKRVAGQTGTTGLDYLNANKDANGYEIVEYPDFPSQSDALITGQVDAAVNDIPVWNTAVTNNPGIIKVVANFDTGDQYGVGMALGRRGAEGRGGRHHRRGQGRRHVRRDLRQVDRRGAVRGLMSVSPGVAPLPVTAPGSASACAVDPLPLGEETRWH